MAEVLLGEYEVEASLGAGGMGHVVRVRSRSTGQRFAVKRAHPNNALARERLLGELRMWIDLPAFPHLVRCHFFRTLGDEIAIFAEYVSGGSLAEALDAGGLATLPEVLDVAIQLAWGLHAAHRLGVVHQDVKPGNVLLTEEGIVKVADFGLARASDTRGARFGGALTRAYCSPEQAELLAGGATATGRLTAATDQWSWGVTLLQLFTQHPPCRHGGQLAAVVLEDFLAQGGQEPGRAALQGLVAEVLRKCFRRRPAERWDSLEQVADVLAVAYLQSTGQVYPRAKPEWPRRASPGQDSDDWDDPRDWLRRVRGLVGEVDEDLEMPAVAESRRGRAAGDLVIYDQAQRRLTALCQLGRGDLEPLLAELCLARSLAHGAADELPGVLRLARQAAELLAGRVVRGESEWAGRLGQALLRASGAARVLGRLPEAVDLASRALVVDAGPGLFLRASLSRASAYLVQEDYPAALADLERARQTCVGDEFTSELIEAELLTARVLREQGETEVATVWLDRALPRLEALAAREPTDEHRQQLAAAYRTRARLLARRNEVPTALHDCERAEHFGPAEEGEQAELLGLRASLLVRLDRTDEALPLYERAESLLDHQVGSLGQMEVLPQLAQVCLQHSRALRDVDAGRALALSERGVSVLESLVSAERPDLASDLALALSVHADTAENLGLDARPQRRAAVILYQELVQTRGRWELLGSLLLAQRAEAWTLAEAGEVGGAVKSLEQAIVVGEGLQAARPQAEVELDLAELRLDLAGWQKALGQVTAAQATLTTVLLRLEHHPQGEALRQRAIERLSTFW